MPPKTSRIDPEQTVRAGLERVSSVGDDLEDVLRQAERDVVDVFARRHNELAPALAALESAKGDLLEIVESNQALFASPRSRKAAGVQANRRKSPDKWEFVHDADTTAELILDQHPTLKGAVSTRTVIDTKQLTHLTPAQLKKLGIKRTSGGETTTIKRLRDDLDERLERVRPWLG